MIATLSKVTDVQVDDCNIVKSHRRAGVCVLWMLLVFYLLCVWCKRSELLEARQRLAVINKRLKEESTSTEEDAKTWQKAVLKFKVQIEDVNTKIHKYNLIVPFLDKQKMPYSPDAEVDRVINHPKKFLPKNKDAYVETWDVTFTPSVEAMQPMSGIKWREVWTDIKAVFGKNKSVSWETCASEQHFEIWINKRITDLKLIIFRSKSVS